MYYDVACEERKRYVYLLNEVEILYVELGIVIETVAILQNIGIFCVIGWLLFSR